MLVYSEENRGSTAAELHQNILGFCFYLCVSTLRERDAEEIVMESQREKTFLVLFMKKKKKN